MKSLKSMHKYNNRFRIFCSPDIFFFQFSQKKLYVFGNLFMTYTGEKKYDFAIRFLIVTYGVVRMRMRTLNTHSMYRMAIGKSALD